MHLIFEFEPTFYRATAALSTEVLKKLPLVASMTYGKILSVDVYR